MRSWYLFGCATLCICSLTAAAQGTPAWLEKLQFFGDLRLRHEYTSKVLVTDENESHRERFRLRLGLQAQINPTIKLKTRLATGDSFNPISANSTFTNNADKKTIGVDLAALDWAIDESMNLWLGKIDNPMRIMGHSQLLFDSDYNPEGAALISKTGRLFLNAMGASIQERGNTNSSSSTANNRGPDIWLLSALLGTKFELESGIGYTLALGYHDFAGIKGQRAIGPKGSDQSFLGNSTAQSFGSFHYANDYKVGELLAEIQMKLANGTLSVFADLANNFSADEDNVAYLAGTQFQTMNEAGKADWTLAYHYRSVEKDATVSAINDSDYGNGIDGNFGHSLIIGKSVAKNVTLTATWFRANLENNVAGNTDGPFWTDKGLLDLNASF